MKNRWYVFDFCASHSIINHSEQNTIKIWNMQESITSKFIQQRPKRTIIFVRGRTIVCRRRPLASWSLLVSSGLPRSLNTYVLHWFVWMNRWTENTSAMCVQRPREAKWPTVSVIVAPDENICSPWSLNENKLWSDGALGICLLRFDSVCFIENKPDMECSLLFCKWNVRMIVWSHDRTSQLRINIFTIVSLFILALCTKIQKKSNSTFLLCIIYK